MTIAQLYTFDAVCRTGSFTEAGRVMNLSQPAVSRQIAALEASLEVTLFDRERSTLRLTPAGEHFYKKLGPILEQLRQVNGELKRIQAKAGGQLKIGFLEDQSLDGGISAAFKRMGEEKIDLQLRRMDFHQLEASLRSGAIDLAISLEQGPGTMPGCRRYVYRREKMCIAVRRELLPPDTELSGDEMLEYFRDSLPILLPRLESFPRNQLRELEKLVERWRQGGADRLEEFSSIAPMVSAGLAAAIANESHCLSVDRDVCMAPLKDAAAVGKAVFWRTESRDPLTDRLVKYLQEEV